MRAVRVTVATLSALVLCLPAVGEPPWPTDPASQSLATRIPPPPGFRRLGVSPDSFGAWLRALPVKPGRPPVRLHDGTLKGNQQAQHVVVDIDVGQRDLQQCADAVMRLRAEYLWASGRSEDVCFRFTSGHKAPWSDWRQGMRPQVSGNEVVWRPSAGADGRYSSFRRYLRSIFIYAGSHSLSRELAPVSDIQRIEPGDVFIQGGFPGHAVLVMDVAQDEDEAESGQRRFLLAQSYMPAQDVHVLRHPGSDSPWYPAREGTVLTPEWSFRSTDLKRFPGPGCP